jgi:hypothetical protein
LLVYGWDAKEQPFHEEAEAFEIKENGSLLWLETRVERGQRLFLINMRNHAEQESQVITIGRRVDGKARVTIPRQLLGVYCPHVFGTANWACRV